MRLSPAIPVILLLASSLAVAQSTPRSEVALNYSWAHTNAPPGGCGCFSLNGGGASYAYRVVPGLRAVVEADAVTNGNVRSTGSGLTLADVLAGGRYTLPVHGRLKPFGEVLIGFAHAAGSLSPAQQGLGSSNAFALNAGGGADFNLSHNLAVRLVQFDYLLTEFPNGANQRQNSLQIKAGIVLRFGR